jgi:16S rRNA (guanine527-N7)-methyltransferase
VAASVPGRILDVGTGAGFPGVPLAIASRRVAVLLDSVAKKTAAVRVALAECHLEGITAVSERAEDYARETPRQFAVVLARAVAPLSALLELGAPFLSDGGRLVLLKGRPAEDEIDAADRVAGIVGVARIGTRDFCLPFSGEQRTVFSYVRTGPSNVALPRRVGLAQRRPLA